MSIPARSPLLDTSCRADPVQPLHWPLILILSLLVLLLEGLPDRAAAQATSAAQMTSATQGRTGYNFFTNRENARHVVACGGYVAFATSGGVRVFDKRTGLWRIWTMQAGLPAHSICDIAFDPRQPTRLWVLAAPWQQGTRLYLAHIDLPAGTVHTLLPLLALPSGAPMHYPGWEEYRLQVTQERVFVYADALTAASPKQQGSTAVFDRRTGAWAAAGAGTIQALPPPLPRLGILLPSQTVAVPLRAVHAVGENAFIFDTEQGLLFFHTRDRAARTAPPNSFITFPWRAMDYRSRHSTISKLRFDARTNAATFEVIEQKLNYNNEIDVPVERSFRVRVRADVKTGKMTVLARKRLNAREGTRVSAMLRKIENSTNDLLHGGWLTDVISDGQSLWFATYNQPGVFATGVACYEIATRRWTYPKDPGGLAANETISLRNVTDTRNLTDTILATTTNGPSLYDPSTDSWIERDRSYKRIGSAEAAFSAAEGASIFPLDWPWPQHLPDPEKKDRGLQIIGREQNERVLWVRWQQPIVWRGPWLLGRVDIAQGKVEQISLPRPELSHFSVSGLLVQQQGASKKTFWLLGEDFSPPGTLATGSSRGPRGKPLVVRWEHREPGERDAITLYDIPLWDNIANALAGSTAPGAAFYEAAGQIWMRASHSLFRYDAPTDTWHKEVPASGVSAVYAFPDAVWVREAHASVPAIGNALLQWTPETGWRRLEVERELVPLAGRGFFLDQEYLWLSGIGVLRLPRHAARFTPLEEVKEVKQP